MRLYFRKRVGLSLMEVMTVIIITGILLATSFFVLKGVGNKMHLNGTAINAKQDLLLARTMALEGGTNRAIDFSSGTIPEYWTISRFDSDSGVWIEVFRRNLPSKIKLGKPNGVTTGPDGSTIPADGVSFSGNKLVFTPRQGTTSSGTIYFTFRDDPKTSDLKAVEVNAAGKAVVFTYDGTKWY